MLTQAVQSFSETVNLVPDNLSLAETIRWRRHLMSRTCRKVTYSRFATVFTNLRTLASLRDRHGVAHSPSGSAATRSRR